MKQQTGNSNGLWSAENLAGTLWIEKPKSDHPIIYRRNFTIPASDAVGPEATNRILRAAGCVHQNIRCTKHSIFWEISTRAEPHEEFCFRHADLPDIEYSVTLTDDYSGSRIEFWPGNGLVEYPKEFPEFLKQLGEKQCDDLRLSFCIPDKLLPEINRVARLHYLTLFECYRSENSQTVFPEIGRLEQLRGLYLRGSGWASLDADAVGELRKLENLESLRVDCGFPISIEAVRELGTLKNLKTLNLELSCYTEHDSAQEVGRAELLSALSSLRSLEKLEFLVLYTGRRLSPRDLALPPKLKYLEMNRRVCRLPVRPAKCRPATKKAKPDDGEHEQLLF